MKKIIFLMSILLLSFNANIARVKLPRKEKPTRGKLGEHWKCAATAAVAAIGVGVAAYKLGKAKIKNELGVDRDSELGGHEALSAYREVSKNIGRPLYLYLLGGRIEGAADSAESQIVLRETGKEDLRYLYKPDQAQHLKPRR